MPPRRGCPAAQTSLRSLRKADMLMAGHDELYQNTPFHRLHLSQTLRSTNIGAKNRTCPPQGWCRPGHRVSCFVNRAGIGRKSMIEAVIWDFGGVFTTSPFEAFARFETKRGLPADIIRRTNASNHLENAWAKFERSEVDIEAFDQLFAIES